MLEPKPLASLSAGLLARKGAARPAMRRQAQLPGNAAFAQDDLGWNDMGYGQLGYDVDPGFAAGDEPRAAGHGLTPMARDDGADAMRDLSAAIDSVIDPAPQADAVVAPIQAETPIAAPSEAPPVHRHMERIEQEYAPAADAKPVARAAPVAEPPVKAEPRGMPVVRARAGSRGTFAFTLRLDPERHLRLRLASAASNRSLQQIMIGLVDDFLASQPEIAAFAARLPDSGKAKDK